DDGGRGRETASLFAREGARVVLVDRDPESARETQAMIEGEGGACFVCEADITRASDCGAFARAALDAYGRIDILHNNVGVGVGDKEAVGVSEEAGGRVLDGELQGRVFFLPQGFPGMPERPPGFLVNT